MKSDKIQASSQSDRIRVAILAELERLSITSGTGATEATLISVLNAIVASDQDIEILLVRDTGDSNKVLQQVTNYETGTPTVSYKDVNGTVVTPIGPIEYLDASAVLNLILTQNTSLNTPVSIANSFKRATDASGSPITGGKRRVAFFNAGDSNCTVLGSILKPGEAIDFESGDLRDGLDDISYDATGSELLITTVG